MTLEKRIKSLIAIQAYSYFIMNADTKITIITLDIISDGIVHIGHLLPEDPNYHRKRVPKLTPVYRFINNFSFSMIMTFHYLMNLNRK